MLNKFSNILNLRLKSTSKQKRVRQKVRSCISEISGDFGVKGITAQSSFLGDLALKKEQYQKIIKQLKTNKLLKQALGNPDSKAALITALNSLIKELGESK